jgi:hypothetical protein
MNTDLLLLLGAFICIAGLPLLPAIFDTLGTDTRAFLEIPHDRNDDPRHFSRRLKDLVAQTQSGDARVIHVDNGSEAKSVLTSSLLSTGSSVLSRLGKKAQHPAETRIAVLSPDASVSSPLTWLGDALARTDIVLPASSVLRTLRCEGHCLLQPGSSVLRWLDARSLFVMGPNRLPHRTTAKNSISLSTGVRFERLYAPLITVQPNEGVTLEDPAGENLPPLPPDVEIWRLDADDETVAGHKVFTGDVYLCADSAVNANVLCDRDLHIGERALIKGNLKIRGDLFLHAGSRIIGHVQCQGAVTLDRRCEIDGVITSLSHLSVAGDCTLGSSSAHTSLIAKTITLHSGVRVYGHIWARQSGMTDV